MSKFEEEIIINGNQLTKKYVQSLNKEQREELILPIFNYFRSRGFIYPDNEDKLWSEYKRICNYKCDLDNKEIFNNDSTGTYICKYFCKSFYNGTEKGKKDIIELFNDDECLKKVIRNRLGLDWYQLHGEDDREAFTISNRQLVQGMRSSRKVSMITIFKPVAAKYIYEKYSMPDDLVYDYSAGFGGRLLGAASCGRRYIGVDPLTSSELRNMIKYFRLNDCNVITDVSENFRMNGESVDLTFSSPPYYDQEVYSSDLSQAYNKGENYFYNTYWAKTLDNCHYMLKPGKIFALNVKNYPKMLDMACDKFKLIDEIYLRTVRSHLNKKAGTEKMESIYIFRKE